MLQVVNEEPQSFNFYQILLVVLGFLPLTFSKYLFAGQGILRLEQQWFLFKVVTKTLEITEDNPKENIFE